MRIVDTCNGCINLMKEGKYEWKPECKKGHFIVIENAWGCGNSYYSHDSLYKNKVCKDKEEIKSID